MTATTRRPPGGTRPAEAVPPEDVVPPPHGSLPDEALAGLGTRPFGLYLHVPFCASRCGYCDFATWTAEELGEGVSRAAWAATARTELELARRALGDAEVAVSTVFVGGGTPTLLPPADVGEVLRVADDLFGLAPDVEVTVEANPETVDAPLLDGLLAVGATRLSVGVQSTASGVLAVLERTHTPGRATGALAAARSAGFPHVSADLISGTPGETPDDLRTSLADVLAAGPDHVSVYSLQVEEGTRLARQVRTGRVPAPDDDAHADAYLAVEEVLTAAGLSWYEISSWARTPADRCRHNVAYWRSDDWWGVGPGAHSHVGGVRWWNVRHPRPWTAALATGRSPAAGREVLDAEERHLERVMLGLRTVDGLDVAALRRAGRAAARGHLAAGLLDVEAFARGTARLTLRGRLLADAVVRDLVD